MQQFQLLHWVKVYSWFSVESLVFHQKRRNDLNQRWRNETSPSTATRVLFSSSSYHPSSSTAEPSISTQKVTAASPLKMLHSRYQSGLRGLPPKDKAQPVFTLIAELPWRLVRKKQHLAERRKHSSCMKTGCHSTLEVEPFFFLPLQCGRRSSVHFSEQITLSTTAASNQDPGPVGQTKVCPSK